MIDENLLFEGESVVALLIDADISTRTPEQKLREIGRGIHILDDSLAGGDDLA